MILSYLIGEADKKNDLICIREAIQKRYLYTQLLSFNKYSCILYSHEDDFSKNVYYADECIVIVCGEIYNAPFIRSLLLVHDPIVLDHELGSGRLVHLLYAKLGIQSFSLLEGAFTILIFRDNSLFVCNDQLNQMHCYYTSINSNGFWVTNEVKNLLINPDIDLSLIEYEQYIDLYQKEYFTPPFVKLSQLHPQNMLEIFFKDGKYKFCKKQLHDFMYEENTLSFNVNFSAVEQIIEESIKNQIQNDRSIGVCLSGGLDCPLVACKTRELFPDKYLFSYTVGHHDKNEFLKAKIIADLIQSKHCEIEIDKKQVLDCYIDVVYDAEILWALDLELMTIMHFIFKKASKDVDILLTGNRTDSMFMGHFNPNDSIATLRKPFIRSVMRSRSGRDVEKFYAAKYGITIRHPFCNARLYQLSLGMNPVFKMQEGHAKYIIRKYGDLKTKLPKEFSWGQKVEMQIGSSMNNIFSEIFKTNYSDEFSSYQQKNPYVYNLFRCIFEKRMQKSEIKELMADKTCI